LARWKLSIQPRISGSWSMMFQVRKLMRFVVWPMAGAASAAGIAAEAFRRLRRASMVRSFSLSPASGR
jgi:hypothetical protein